MIELLLAQVLNFDNAFNERLGDLCENNNRAACQLLVELTDNQCAGPEGSGCAYNSTNFVIIDPEEPMIKVRGLEHLGWSRISTVQHCAYLTGVDDYDNLMTDAEFEGMEACLIEHT